MKPRKNRERGIRMNLTHKNRRNREWNEIEIAKKIRYFKKKKISADIVRTACNLCFHDDDIDAVIMEFSQRNKTSFLKRKLKAIN